MDRSSMLALVDKFDADLSVLGNNIDAGIVSIRTDLANFRAAVNALPAQALTEADLVAIADRLRPTLLAAAESVLGITPTSVAPGTLTIRSQKEETTPSPVELPMQPANAALDAPTAPGLDLAAMASARSGGALLAPETPEGNAAAVSASGALPAGE